MRDNIAIDGPAGAGKSTVARQLAKRLGYLYIDTGAMYRALTWKALKEGTKVTDEAALVDLARNTSLEFKEVAPGEVSVYCDGEDVTRLIRSPEVSRHVSTVAAWPRVREEMVKLQRDLAARRKVVMDGRDIGTHVLPEANHKFFLTASLEERARRRWQELIAQGNKFSLEEIKREIEERDRRDSQRIVAPLRPAPDAVIIDTSNLTPEEVTEHILKTIRKNC
ncbi:cytidylate kinase [Thermanaeromonas toyohensis ToBE]|uniref:Cytidylate kinase n=1 Tax=Thermanaeromonas toyohensis ToBE TaxID=698762 RepID=A0A1W1VYB5_9FIRM|nr:(d)CMP kinase [Thermanaeromonas toyohensis]SMB98326.1 cytidylate kinase [Thermanaeromonas toyohensis ToBE]